MDDLKATAISLGLSTGSFVITLILFSDWYWLNLAGILFSRKLHFGINESSAHSAL
jgi:hypothetical protein